MEEEVSGGRKGKRRKKRQVMEGEGIGGREGKRRKERESMEGEGVVEGEISDTGI